MRNQPFHRSAVFNTSEFLRILPRLQGSFHYAQELVSSNDTAIELVKNGAESGTLVLTESQKKGRGRGGNAWSCPKGEGLLFSLVLEPDIERNLWPRLALAAGVAVSEVLEKYGVTAEIKWPNDVWIQGKKCAGVLVEGCGDCVVVGIGLNVSVVSFPEELRDSATSLTLEGVTMVKREELLANIVEKVFHWGSRCGEEGFADVVAAVNQRCALRGEMIQLAQDGNLKTGMMAGVSAEGYLLLETGEKLEKIAQADAVRRLRP